MAEKTKKGIFNSPLLSSKVKGAKPKFFPEAVLGYFGGPTLALVANSFLASYFNKYLTDLYGITSWAALFNTLLPVVSVIFVVLGNILVGRLMDKNKMKAGKARPLLLLSLPVSLLALATLFFITPFADEASNGTIQIVSLILIAVGYNLWFAIAYPLYFTPHSALVNLSTRNSKDRSLLATLSNATHLGAMGLCTMVLPFFLGLLFKYQMDITKLPDGYRAVLDLDTGVVQYYVDANGGVIYDVPASLVAWKIFAIGLLVVTLVGVLTEYYFTRERVTEEAFAMQSVNVEQGEQKKKKTITIGEQWKICRRDKFWIFMIIFFFLFQLGGMLKNVSQLYYCTAWFPDNLGNYTTVSGGIYSGLIGLIGAAPTALGMVIALPLSNKIGKAKAILYGALVSTLGGALGFLVPFVPVDARFIITVISFIIKALGSTPAMYLSIALLGDIMDHQEALHGKRTDGLSMTIYGAIMAGMTGVATGILNLALSLSGYTPDHPDVAQNAMLWIFIGAETLCYLGIAIMFIFMNVEKYSKLDHEAIVEDQKALCARNGQEYISPEDRMKAEEEEADRKSEEAFLAELKVKCEKKNLDYEAELAKHNEELEANRVKAEEKAKAAEEKRLAKEKLLADKYAALTDEQKAALEAKKAAREEKDKLLAEEYALLREATKESREAALAE